MTGHASSSRWHPSAPLALVLSLVLPLIGACSVVPSPDDTRTDDARARLDERRESLEAAAAVLEGGLRIDVSRPPSREDLAMVDGRTSAVLEPDEGTVDVVVAVADETVLETPTEEVVVYAPDGAAPPTGVDLTRRGLTDAELAEAVARAVADLGVDRAEADQALASLEGPLDADASVALDATAPPPARVQLLLRRTALEGRNQVSYLVEW